MCGVKHLLLGYHQLRIGQIIAACVVVAVMVGEIAARDLQSNPMTFEDAAGCRSLLDPVLCDLTWCKKLFAVQRIIDADLPA